MFVQGSHAFAMFLAHALRECALFRNTTYILTHVYVIFLLESSACVAGFVYTEWGQSTKDTVSSIAITAHTHTITHLHVHTRAAQTHTHKDTVNSVTITAHTHTQ